jgi:hypothetical protein
MVQSATWGANSHAAGQEVTSLYWDLRVHYSLRKSLPLDPTVIQLTPVHTLNHFIKAS